LALLLAVELDARARALATYLRGGTQGAALTPDLLALALGDKRADALLEFVGAGGPLRGYRLVDVTARAADVQANATVCASPRLIRWWIDPEAIDQEVARFAVLHPAAASPSLPPAALGALEPLIREVSGFLESQRRGRARGDLLLRGPRGAGRLDVAREACRRLGLPLLVSHVTALLGWPNPAEAIGTLIARGGARGRSAPPRGRRAVHQRRREDPAAARRAGGHAAAAVALLDG
jgi:hypothetical protein